MRPLARETFDTAYADPRYLVSEHGWPICGRVLDTLETSEHGRLSSSRLLDVPTVFRLPDALLPSLAPDPPTPPPPPASLPLSPSILSDRLAGSLIFVSEPTLGFQWHHHHCRSIRSSCIWSRFQYGW